VKNGFAYARRGEHASELVVAMSYEMIWQRLVIVIEGVEQEGLHSTTMTLLKMHHP
jgi:hypothetical protein